MSLNMNMSKKNIVIAVIVILVVAGVGLYFNKTKGESGYSVVYMTTGEVYVGNLRLFPELELTNAYILQVVKDEKDPAKNNFQLNPVNQALWAPESMHLIKDNVAFYGTLLSDSKIAQTLAEKGK